MAIVDSFVKARFEAAAGSLADCRGRAVTRPRGQPLKSVQQSKYSSNSCGVGRRRTASSSFVRL